ncbi:serine/threonine protein kinase [Methylophaga muralis]|uniref:Serine/threonine protein kinase n=2 Tax=Methylophaga muralis TaxID=291169 RepID=A0A1E3GNP8_9GAMM|nr:serine/threonine protein kinase [Methylophaga muralis]
MAGLYNEEYLQRLAGQIQELLGQWNIDEAARVSLLTVSENATFLVNDENNDQRFIIRVHRPEYHSKHEIHSELLWIQSLRQQALLNTPEPLTMRDGSLIAAFEDDGVERYLVAFEFMPGKQPDEDESLIEGFEILGATSARLHQQARQWSLPEGFSRKKWNFDSAFGANPLWGDWRNAPGLDEAGQAILEQLCEILEAKLHHYGESRIDLAWCMLIYG